MGNLLGAPVTDKETHTGGTTTTSGSDSIQWGVSSMQGWRVHMEDAHIAEGNLYAVVEGDDDDNDSSSNDTKIPVPGHALFAVFDGHGGTFAACYAGKNFLRVLSKQPKWVEYAQAYNNSTTNAETTTTTTKQELMTILEQALQQAFVEIDYEIGLAIRGHTHPHANQEYHLFASTDGDATMSDAAGAVLDGTTTTTAATTTADTTNSHNTMRDAASRAAADHVSALEDDGDSGTTACIVVITPDSLVCANAGDSRAVFSRRTNGGDKSMPARQAIALSYDHKPDDEAEERRIRAAGGYVAGGRVEGDLAVSRGLGDFRFKSMAVVLNNTQLFPTTATTTTSSNDTDEMDNQDSHEFQPGDQKVSPIPDILVHSRNHDIDEFVIVACDGIWDVRTNQECVMEVATMFQEGETNMGLICEELLDTCLRLGSKDNMTAIVVKLPGQKTGVAATAAAGGNTGGVMGRRRQREESLRAQQEADEDGSQQHNDDDDDDDDNDDGNDDDLDDGEDNNRKS